MSSLVVFLACLLGQLQPVELVNPITFDQAMLQYEAQADSRETLTAMAVLDSLSDRTFWIFRNHEMRWNSQLQEIAITTDGVDLDVTSGVDGQGRQIFESAEISGWVDVDTVHNRIIIATESTLGIVQLITDDTGIVYSISSTQICRCTAGQSDTMCLMRDCNDNKGCRRGVPPNESNGNCVKRTIDDGGGCGGASLQTAPLAMTVMSLVGWKTARRRRRHNSLV